MCGNTGTGSLSRNSARSLLHEHVASSRCLFATHHHAAAASGRALQSFMLHCRVPQVAWRRLRLSFDVLPLVIWTLWPDGPFMYLLRTPSFMLILVYEISRNKSYFTHTYTQKQTHTHNTFDEDTLAHARPPFKQSNLTTKWASPRRHNHPGHPSAMPPRTRNRATISPLLPMQTASLEHS